MYQIDTINSTQSNDVDQNTVKLSITGAIR